MLEDQIIAAELELVTLQSEVTEIEANIETHETELPRYRKEIRLLEVETLAALTELETLRQTLTQDGIIPVRMAQTELFCVKFHHNSILREAIYERSKLSRCQDQLIDCLEQWKAKMTRVPELQKQLIALYKKRKKEFEKEEEVRVAEDGGAAEDGTAVEAVPVGVGEATACLDLM